MTFLATSKSCAEGWPALPVLAAAARAEDERRWRQAANGRPWHSVSSSGVARMALRLPCGLPVQGGKRCEEPGRGPGEAGQSGGNAAATLGWRGGGVAHAPVERRLADGSLGKAAHNFGDDGIAHMLALLKYLVDANGRHWTRGEGRWGAQRNEQTARGLRAPKRHVEPAPYHIAQWKASAIERIEHAGDLCIL